jgi:UDP-N-acetylmuramoyl-L-alanyl-D-glutamate--2,6-diaminopimelate ligase
MKVNDIIGELKDFTIAGDRDREIRGLTFDSRQVKPGYLFAAIRGQEADGHRFIPLALEAGASVIVAEEDPSPGISEDRLEDLTWIRTSSSRLALALMAAAWYDHPSRELHLVGVTGTNGKTTIATLLYQVHTQLGYSAGLLSTIEVRVGQDRHPATHTTPDPVQINRMLREMVEAGCGYCFMEVSSHAIDQERTAGLEFKGGIFTNLSRDHLDYHKDFREYLEVKKRFFDQLPQTSFALVNADDKNGRVMLQNCKARHYGFSLRTVSDFRAKIVEMHLDGSLLEIGGREIWVKLPGRFNASNLLCVFAAGILGGQQEAEMLEAISRVDAVRGRFETYRSDRGVTAVVDYAHSPDALGKVLETLREVNVHEGEIITVVGAGGNRDRGKRPQMGAIAAEGSHKTILTSDNPREEDPEAILDDMMEGVPQVRRDTVLRITSREEAIRTACLLAGEGDIILVAGKGHENYQIIGEKKIPFDDMMILQKNLNPA